MKKRDLLLMFVLTAFIAPAAGCLYHKPEFSGQILDKETKQPIEGAVVVAVYNKENVGFGAGANTDIITVQEALTNNNGKFHIPSYTTFLAPIFTRESFATFIIFKPGYASLSGINLEEYFLNEKGSEREMTLLYTTQTIRFSPHGIVELPKIKTREERIKAMQDVSIPGPDIPSRKMQTLIKIYNEENNLLGFHGAISLP